MPSIQLLEVVAAERKCLVKGQGGGQHKTDRDRDDRGGDRDEDRFAQDLEVEDPSGVQAVVEPKSDEYGILGQDSDRQACREEDWSALLCRIHGSNCREEETGVCQPWVEKEKLRGPPERRIKQHPDDCPQP